MDWDGKMENKLSEIIKEIVDVKKNDVNNENANMSSETPAGQMMKIASEVSKKYALENLISEEYRKAHERGDIHIHDLDYYSSKTSTCLQYDLEKMFENGFYTKHGFIREAKSISTYATLATIIFQTNQNEQHGGQAIPAFDFFMAKGVLKSFRKHMFDKISTVLFLEDNNNLEKIGEFLEREIKSISLEKNSLGNIANFLKMDIEKVKKLWELAYKDTKKETYQGMEGFLHNLNTMHSRGGNQVVFSSINYGTDTSPEGRMVVRELLRATRKGLGNRETPIFPIQIFKVKENVNFCEEDFEIASKNFNGILDKILENDDFNEKNKVFKSKNFDLLMLSCKVTSERLFPNYVFLDTEFNKNEKWKESDPQRYRYEIATMGCRTRVFENIHGEKSSIGRGNLSFTSINFPRIAMEVKGDVEKNVENFEEMSTEKKREILKEKFLKEVERMSNLVGEQLYERYLFQKSALGKQFPFMKNNDLWKGMGEIGDNEEVGEALRTGTLGIGFVGGSNGMYALFGEHHGENDFAYSTLVEALEKMNEVTKKFTEKYKLNYSVLATPAESLGGRFLKLDRKKYGVVKNVTDREYYTNSFHIDVKEKIMIFEKIKKEAPFHKLTKGGHITYVELDGEAKKNVGVILKIVKAMKDNQIGYGSINHPVDRCKDCGIETIIYEECPCCKSKNISRIRRITGYLTGDLDSWNGAKRAEERDRVKHGL